MADARPACHTRAQATPEARPPVFAFNAGVLTTQSYEASLRALSQRTLILSGEGDKRVGDRQRYASEMRQCSLRSLPGANVMPWEAPRETCRAIAAFTTKLQASA